MISFQYFIVVYSNNVVKMSWNYVSEPTWLNIQSRWSQMWFWLILINHNYRKFERTWQFFFRSHRARKENEVWWLKHVQPHACGCWLNSCWIEPQIWSASVAASSLQAGDHDEWRTRCLPHTMILAWLSFYSAKANQNKQMNEDVSDAGPSLMAVPLETPHGPDNRRQSSGFFGGWQWLDSSII